MVCQIMRTAPAASFLPERIDFLLFPVQRGKRNAVKCDNNDRKRKAGTEMNQNHNEGITENQLKAALIQQYANLQRIKNAENRDQELRYQEQTLRAILDVLGISPESLEL